MSLIDLYIKSLPFLDKKWLKADLNSSLRNPDDLAILWNNLIQDNELSLHNSSPSINAAGNISYTNEDGKHYCGQEMLSCTCCTGYCAPTSACNCTPCQQLDAEDAATGSKKLQNILNLANNFIPSESILDSWLWGPLPTAEQKSYCIKSLLSEQREIALRSAGNCLSAQHLKQRLYIYDRYFTALARTKIENQNENQRKNLEIQVEQQKLQKFGAAGGSGSVESPIKDADKATMGLARVGTRAALNFSFAFLRRAWRSGEDTELCSELLLEALEALHDLPEASLFDSTQVSQLWIEVLERSIKFLRQVVLGDVNGGRCSVPRDDRYIALSLLLELAAQKGTLGASLEAVVLLLTLWEKEKETDDNRALPQDTGAPLVPVLRRYEHISNFGLNPQMEAVPASPTESFLRFLTLPDIDTAPIDLKQAAVVIISHLDRLAKPHLPTRNFTLKTNSKQSQQIFTLGWQCHLTDSVGFTEEPIMGVSAFPGSLTSHYSAATLDLGGAITVQQVVCAESSFLILSNKGDVFMLNSVGTGNTTPSLVEGFESAAIIHLAAHCEGKHFMALSADQEVYSWGTGEGGRLGHGDTNPRENPTKIQALSGKCVIGIFCGSTYSAAVTSAGELYSWGRGTYGRLGIGSSDDKLSPILLQSLKSHKVIDMALGTGDSHTLCVTEDGSVFAWGDGDFGKLGNGTINGSQLPIQVESLSGIAHVYSGAQYSVALSHNGIVYTWGKGTDGRLGHGNSDHLSTPTIVEALLGKKIVDVAVGSAHCLALSSTGELYGWGRNDNQQICPPSISRDPIILQPILATPISLRVSGLTCGPAQTIIWSNTTTFGLPTRIPFVIDLSDQSFRLLELLLGMVTGGGQTATGELRQPPSQEAECIAVACLNLLRLQLHALIANNIAPKIVGLGEGSRLLSSLKTRILGLAGGSSILKTIQEAAQWALQAGWSVLLPTASERAQTLTSLLPSGVESGISTSGHRFMTDLLVGSLMAEGGLQTALNQAINSEPEDCSSGHNLPLLHLVKQLLRNNSALTQARLAQLLVGPYIKTENDYLSPEPPSPSIDLLHRFQRLLLSHIHQSKVDELGAAEALLGKYVSHVINLCIATLTKAHEVALQSKDAVDEVLKADISDTLLYELLLGLVLLHRDKSTILQGFAWTKSLIPLLHALDNLNRLIGDCEIQDADDMSWPAIICRGAQKSAPVQEETFLIRKSDIENHVLDGGRWIIVNGFVYDIQDYQCDNQGTAEVLNSGAGKDLTGELSQPQHRAALEYITSHLRVGKYGTSDTDEKAANNKSTILLTHFNSERTLAYLLGLRAGLLQKGPPLQQAEIQCKGLMKSLILGGGLQVLQPSNPFDEEKGEARSSASTAGSTPTEASNQAPITSPPQLSTWPHTQISQRVDSLLYGLGESRVTEPLISAWIALVERYCKENNLMVYQYFPPEHPIQELERLLAAVLIRHQGMGPLVLAVLDRELSGICNKPPKPVVDIIRIVHSTKWNLIRTRQQLNRSYKEVCAPMLDRCRFLLFEVRPVISQEQSGLQRLNILHRHPRFKSLAKRIIVEMRNARDQLESGKPEDILNVTIQSQNASMRMQNSTGGLIGGHDIIPVENKEGKTNDGGIVNDSDGQTGIISPPINGDENKNDDEVVGVDGGVGGGVVGGGGGDREIFYSEKRPDDLKTPTNDINAFNNNKKSKEFGSTEQFINDVILKLSEKSLHEAESIDSNYNIMNQIVEFVMQDVCDVETLRRAMYCQVQRYQIRKQGLEMFTELLSVTSGVFEAVRYNLLSGYLGLYLDNKTKQHSLGNILDDLNMITAFQKAEIIIKYSKILDWSIGELQKFINQEQIFGKHKYHQGKDNSNLGTYVFLKKLSRARFLLSVFGILSKDFGPNELSLLINSGILGSILGLLRQTGGDVASSKIGTELSVIYEDTILRQRSSKANLTGPELAKLMKIGTKVVRGADWKWGDQDGPPPGEGRIVSEVGEDGWVRVEWDTGSTNSYRMGKEGQYDLRLADSASNVVSPDTETNDKEDLLSDFQLNGDSHPTKLLKHTCIKMLQILSVGVGQHGDKMQITAVRGVSSMFRAILSSKIGFLSFGLEHWTTFGFLRSIASSKVLSKSVTSESWMDFHINILDSLIVHGEQDVYKKIQCLRLLQTTLVNWTEDDRERISGLVDRLFHTLGRICLYCPNDLSLIQNPSDVKSRVLLSASYSGTIAEEMIVLLRRLHTMPLWNSTINSFLSQKLCVAADLVNEADIEANFETERIYVMGTLNTIGGCDPRSRIGLNVTHEGQRGTIAKFTNKGNVIMSLHQNGESKKLTIKQVNDCADLGAFSLSKLPINEILLNSWSVLLFGPGERKLMITGNINISLLRSQQVQLATLNASCVLFRHQNILRKVLRQRSPGFLRYNSEGSLSDREHTPEEPDENGGSGGESGSSKSQPDSNSTSPDDPKRDTELLIQSILVRATQPSPVKAIYSFQELSLAALNLSQMLSSHVHAEISAPFTTRPAPPPAIPTLIHGVPIYNDAMLDEMQTTPCSEDTSLFGTFGGGGRKPPCPLTSQIMEMGFTRKNVELAIRTLTAYTEVPPTAEQIIQWILEHPDQCPPIAGTSSAVAGLASFTNNHQHHHQQHHLDVGCESDSESLISDLDDFSGAPASAVTAAAVAAAMRYKTRDDFGSADQYAMYVRGIVCPGMTVRCCHDFEEIRKGDIGTVLKVDTEGLHDLNVQVDWQMHDSSYWMCFLHIELLEPPKESTAIANLISVGNHVRIKGSTPRGKSATVTRTSVGVVTAVVGREIQVDFGPTAGSWSGNSHELELVPHPNQSGLSTENGDLIEDWSRVIRSLTVSSNESTAKHLLDRSQNYWQSTSSSSQGKHWVRLEMHENVLIHSLSITVNPNDYSYMPALVVVRVGDSLLNLKDHSWVSVKTTDTQVPLLSDAKQYHQWIEIQVKQCRNNGIQCRIHSLNIVGRRKQTDLEMMLMKAAFLAAEISATVETSSSASYSSYSDDKSAGNDAAQGCKVFVWGLNDKEQLGGMKGSKVKIPSLSTTLSQLRPIHIAGGSKSLFVVSQDGKVYACGEGTNGRLGLGHNCNVSAPRQIPVLSQYVVKKVAVHSGGKHALALTLDGKVFSWGEGEDGKLGHGNRITLDKPKLIETLRSRRIRDIACGSSHSAAITSSGELYTWGLGEYGRLGHGDNSTQLKPKLVSELLGHRVVQVACGSRDAQTLALTEDGLVFSWGDGDFGKLGRGGSEGCSVPHQIERLNGFGVTQIECGAQFSLALTKSGEVWTWGKGDYYRLGHGSDQHVRKPTPIQGLRGKKIIHVAVGALHCLAVSDTGQVFAWGDNDHGQQGSGSTMVNKKPCPVIGLEGLFVNRVACGSSHSIAWSLPQSPAEEDKREAVAFPVAKDPLGGNSLGIYDSETQAISLAGGKSTSKPSLSDNLLSLESYGARQTALNYILNAMSILQARQCVVAALTSHSSLSSISEKMSNEATEEGSNGGVGVSGPLEHETDGDRNENGTHGEKEQVIAQGGGEGPADVTVLAGPDVNTPDSEVAPSVPSAGPLAALQSLTGSLSLSASISSCNATQKISKMSASAMSVMAVTMTHQEEMVNETSLTGLDEFTSLLGESEAKSLIELLKLSVSGRTGPPSTVQTIANTLIALGSNNPAIGAMLLETCITELEDLCTSRHCLGKIPKPVVQETSHPYIDDVTLVGHVKIPGAEALRLEFDSQCSTEKRNDPLVIMDASGRVIATRSGREFAQWAPEIRIPGNEMRWKFTSDNSVNGWGFRFWVHAIMPTSFLQELSSDRAVLSQPSMDLTMALLDARIDPQNQGILLRLADALASCAQLSILTPTQRIWALRKLHSILLLKQAPKILDPSVTGILNPLIPVLQRQYEYEEPQVRGGVHLTHSEFFKTLAALACDMQLDTILPTIETPTWAWFRRYCSAVRVAQSLIKRNHLPKTFCLEVRRKLTEMIRPSSAQSHGPSLSSGIGTISPGPNSLSSVISSQTNLLHFMDSLSSSSGQGSTSSQAEVEKLIAEDDQYLYEDHNLFKLEHDSQLLQWLNRRPEDWAMSWGGASTIYGWGHNHRGQLGGLEGGRIKTPTPCEALSLLRPVQLAGGEQTLFAVTPDGKLFATGYGAGGRLGIGGTDSVSTPTLVESLQHVFVKKVAVNSGGKHCLALTADGEVYSWGEGEDGKLGHGNRVSYDRPKLIEMLSGVGVVDIACGSAHSACITSQGTVITWGKGRYGRLGHGDSEDQLRPKTVEVLLGYRAIDIACGSGDAQTLCITDDDNVWSWGDGDYGKLGRGGSDGCKVPMKIESLAGLGVIKVECGSQFSVALTRSGAVYTWGKGDYHRLGHGTVDHVRRPKKVAALQGKKIISIATGSLHCVACSDSGEVFTWGDNDEGQLGDGTVTAIQRPRLVTALQGKLIVKVTCGSAHTLALSTYQFGDTVRTPPAPPLEYDLVRDLPAEALHGRLVLLHHFSEILCPCLAMLPISGELSLGALKEVLVYSIKEAAFRKVIQTTMVRDKQHGPVIELNRIQVKRSRTRSAGGLAGVDGMKSVFGQMVQKLPLLTQEALSLPHRVWKVKFVGESVDDCGGGYSESIAEMCDELQNGSVPLLIQTPNGRGEAGANRDCFLLDPTLASILQMNMFRFLGVLMGIAVRTGSPLSLNLAEPVWRQLAGESLRPTDLTEVDRDYVAGLLCIRDMEDDPKVFNTLELPFSTPSAKGHEVPLSTKYTRIVPSNRQEYVKLALSYRLHEFDEQVKAVRDGMSKIIPVPLLSLFTASELQAMVCGSPDIPLALLKSVATYKGVESHSPLVQWFWEVMEEFSNQERSLFLRFVWGRTRLPRTIADFRGRDFVLQVLDKYIPADHFLPESYTCFFLLKMPRYSCKSVLHEKLKYAIHFCKSIDTDEYARVAMGDPLEATGSEDNSDLESVISTQDV